MYKFLAVNRILSVIKPDSSYEWFTYKGRRPIDVEFRGKTISIKKGQRFGVRKSANKKQIRMVLEDQANRVITLSLDQAQKLAKGV